MHTGVFSMQELADAGWDRARLRAALQSGTLSRVARGCYATTSANPASILAGLRLFFRGRAVPVRTQVAIPGVGRVDLLVGRSLIVEADSRRFHTSEADYANDRRRDLVAHTLGYRTVRLTYHQVFADWTATRSALVELLRQRVHRRSPCATHTPDDQGDIRVG